MSSDWARSGIHGTFTAADFERAYNRLPPLGRNVTSIETTGADTMTHQMDNRRSHGATKMQPTCGTRADRPIHGGGGRLLVVLC